MEDSIRNKARMNLKNYVHLSYYYYGKERENITLRKARYKSSNLEAFIYVLQRVVSRDIQKECIVKGGQEELPTSPNTPLKPRLKDLIFVSFNASGAIKSNWKKLHEAICI